MSSCDKKSLRLLGACCKYHKAVQNAKYKTVLDHPLVWVAYAAGLAILVTAAGLCIAALVS